MYRKEKTCGICFKPYIAFSTNGRYCGNAKDKTSCKQKSLLIALRKKYLRRKADPNYKFPIAIKHRRKLELIEKYGYKCQVCQIASLTNEYPYSFFDMDHKDSNPKNNRLENLWLLCPNCHRLKTINTGDWKITVQRPAA